MINARRLPCTRETFFRTGEGIRARERVRGSICRNAIREHGISRVTILNLRRAIDARRGDVVAGLISVGWISSTHGFTA